MLICTVGWLGCADLLNQNLNREFGVSGFVKPGAKTSDILDTNIDKDMSKDDVIVVCAGTNDISKNSAKEGLRNIINFVRRNSHTNIMVMEVLHRHDLVDWSCVNKEVRSFNRHLAKFGVATIRNPAENMGYIRILSL
jgi:lysophospholipase L1-like esterase